MGSRDDRKLQLFVQHATAVSRALWPAKLRHGLSTGKASQRRRSLIIRGKWWAIVIDVVRVRYPRILAVISPLIGSMIVVTVAFHLWYLLILTLAILVASLTWPFFVAYRFLDHPGSQNSSSLLQYELKNLPGLPAFLRAPETPVPPEAPLVRVLKTFDLSETGVEHFLDTKEGGDTAELHIDWSEEKAAEYRSRTMPMRTE